MSIRYRAPRAFCDRCDGEFYNYELGWQMIEADDKLVNSRWLVCAKCMDRTELPKRSRQRIADPYPIFPPGFEKPR